MTPCALWIIGANGQLATTLRLGLALGRAAHRPFFAHFDPSSMSDLGQPASLRERLALFSSCSEARGFKRRIVVVAGAYTAVDMAEEQTERTFSINSRGVQTLARIAQERGMGLLSISSDYVFDGLKGTPYEEGDTPHPLSQYGLSKLHGELAIQTMPAGQGCVVRTSWLFSPVGHNFLLTIRNRLLNGQPLQVVADQVGSPTYAPYLAHALWLLMEQYAEYGVFPHTLLHVAGAGETSWHGFATEIARGLGKTAHPILPIATAGLNQAARRPAYSTLCSDLAYKALSLPPIPWEKGVAACLRAIEKGSWYSEGSSVIPPAKRLLLD